MPKAGVYPSPASTPGQVSAPARVPPGVSVSAPALAVPPSVVTNAEVAERLGVSEDWIQSRTGIRERHALGDGERLSDLAAAAGSAALARADLAGCDLDLVLVATSSQDEITPNTAPLVAADIGAVGAAAIDVGAACTGFLSALALGAAQIEAGRARTALVIGAEALTRFLDRDDRLTAGLFGDGAGAVVMTATDSATRVKEIVLGADGSGWDLVRATRREGKIRMQGHETFKHAVTRLCESTLEALASAELELADIDLFVFHQANARILRAVGERLDLPAGRVIDCIERYGNTSAASIPIALAEAESTDRLHDGDRVLLAAFGAGLTWGAGVVEWGRHAA